MPDALPQGLIRIPLADLTDYLEARNLQIWSCEWPAGTVTLVPRELLPCGHPTGCRRLNYDLQPICLACERGAR